MAGAATERDNRRAVGVAPAGATRPDSRRYSLGEKLAGRLYYTTFISSKIPIPGELTTYQFRKSQNKLSGKRD
jgi:hypothetical protein